MKVNELNYEQKEQFCRACATVMFNEETDSAYSKALDFLEIQEPEDFNYNEGHSGEMYEKAQEVMADTYYIRLLFTAMYDADWFPKEYIGYESFVIAMKELANYVEADSEYDDFGEFCDSIVET